MPAAVQGDRCRLAAFRRASTSASAIPSAAPALPVRPVVVVCDVPSHVAKKLVLIGAPSEMTWLFKGFGKVLRLSPKTQGAFEGVVERLSGRRLEDFDAARILEVRAVPTLIIHAEDDKEVSADHARRYAAAGPNVELHWANGYGHRRIVSASSGDRAGSTLSSMPRIERLQPDRRLVAHPRSRVRYGSEDFADAVICPSCYPSKGSLRPRCYRLSRGERRC